MSKPKHKVTVGETEVLLSSTEFKLFNYLQRHCGVLVTRQQVMKDVFGNEAMVFDRAVDTHVKILKRKLGKANECIEIVKGVGYRFKEI